MYRIPNRIFVGGIPQTASQDELRDYFAHFGYVKDARIITDNRGNSKGYGFVTYNSENDASKVLCLKEDELIFKESKLNIGHAFRKKNPTNSYNPGSSGMMMGGAGHHMMSAGGHANSGMANSNYAGHHANNNYMDAQMGSMPPHHLGGFSNPNNGMAHHGMGLGGMNAHLSGMGALNGMNAMAGITGMNMN